MEEGGARNASAAGYVWYTNSLTICTAYVDYACLQGKGGALLSGDAGDLDIQQANTCLQQLVASEALEVYDTYDVPAQGTLNLTHVLALPTSAPSNAVPTPMPDPLGSAPGQNGASGSDSSVDTSSSTDSTTVAIAVAVSIGGAGRQGYCCVGRF